MKKEPFLTLEEVKEITKTYPTPFHIYDEKGIRENVRRLKAENIEIKLWDGRKVDPEWEERADVVIADVPCSGIGVIGRKPEIRYMAVQNAPELQSLQRDILRGAVRALKPGGTLIYSTCTIHSKENEDMVRHIAEELGFEPVSLEGLLPERLFSQRRRLEEDMQKAGKDPARGLSEREHGACIQLLPGYMESDGFFLAKFRRKDIEEPM